MLNLTRELLSTTGQTVVLASGIISLLVFLGKPALRAWVLKGVEHAFDRKLEAFKSELSARTLRELAAHTAGASAQMIGAQKRIEAVEILWHSVLAIRNRAQMPFGSLAFLTEEEYLAKASEFLDPLTDSVVASTDFIKDCEKSGTDALRPFLSPVLWRYYSVHRTFYARLIFLDARFLSGNRDAFWTRDKGVLQILKQAMQEEKFQHVLTAPFQDPTRILSILENEILEEIWKLVNGEAIGKESLEHVEALSRMASAAILE